MVLIKLSKNTNHLKGEMQVCSSLNFCVRSSFSSVIICLGRSSSDMCVMVCDTLI